MGAATIARPRMGRPSLSSEQAQEEEHRAPGRGTSGLCAPSLQSPLDTFGRLLSNSEAAWRRVQLEGSKRLLAWVFASGCTNTCYSVLPPRIRARELQQAVA